MLKPNIYNEFCNRNYLFINKFLQNKIHNTTLSFIGCGLSSSIAVLAVRSGFLNFILVDGDKVELTNLNRQNYNFQDIGSNKAKKLKSILTQINPNAIVKSIDKMISRASNYNLILSDFIINTVDLNSVFYKLIEEALDRKKIVIIPLNIGYGSMVLIINNKEIYKYYFEKFKPTNEIDLIKYLFKLNSSVSIPNYLKSNLNKIINETKAKGYNSQIGIASNITSSLVILKIFQLLNNDLSISNFSYVDLFKFRK